MPNASEDAQQYELSFIAAGMQNGTAAWEDGLAISYKTKMTPTIGPGFMLCGIYPKEMKTYIHTKTCTWVFTAALCIIARTGK